MNILFGLAMIISALTFAYIYKVRTKKARDVFAMCVCIGVVLMFSVQTFGNVLLVLLTLVELALSAALLLAFRAQLRADAETARAKAHARRAKKAVQVTVRRRDGAVTVPYVA